MFIMGTKSISANAVTLGGAAALAACISTGCLYRWRSRLRPLAVPQPPGLYPCCRADLACRLQWPQSSVSVCISHNMVYVSKTCSP